MYKHVINIYIYIYIHIYANKKHKDTSRKLARS